MYKASDIGRFSREILLPRFPEPYVLYKKRDIVRMRANFAQLLMITVGRGGYIKVLPTFFVVGADLEQEIVHQTVSLRVVQPDRWLFSPDTPLDGSFASLIIERLELDSPISFIDPLRDSDIENGLRWFSRLLKHWSAHQFLAFFNITRGADSARADCMHAYKFLRQYTRLSTEKPLLDWEVKLRDRFLALEARLDSSDCIESCRLDSQEHARKLGLPEIVWPSEWHEECATLAEKSEKSQAGD